MSFLSDIFGSNPNVAQYQPVNYTDEQKKSLQGNIANFGDISQLGNLFQNYLQSSLEKQLPGYSNILKSGANSTQSILDAADPLLKGQIPKDVQDQIQRSDAFKSFSGGFGGSQMGAGLTARDLGRTSLDLINQGANLANQGGNAAQNWSKIAEGTTFNPSSMFVTPQQQEGASAQNNLFQQQGLQNQYNVDASANPVAQGLFNTGSSIVGGLLGHAGGGGGGGGM